jgi:hypothetical protein
MLSEKEFTKENLNKYLSELAKEYKKVSGRKVPAEIILVGGAAVLAGYDFREKTFDMDGIISASSAMKDAINNVGEKMFYAVLKLHKVYLYMNLFS